MTEARTSETLHDGWELEVLDGSRVPAAVRDAGRVPASVPGTVHTDLMAAGLLADPCFGTNEQLQEWVGSTSWRYGTTFDAPTDGAERIDLVFEGLDTVATVRLNDEVVLRSRDQHRSHRVPVQDRLRAGSNRLDVEFAAPVPEADRASLELEYRPHVNHHPYNAVRKMACSFGWDWGPDTATSGIWRPVRIERWSTARIADLVVVAEPDGHDGVVRVRARLERTDDRPLTLRAEASGVETSVEIGSEEVELVVRVPDAERWHPRGRGPQTLHALTVRLLDGGEELDAQERRIGFRTVRADMTPDAAGTPFTLLVNDEPVFVKGVNWIPDDPFPHRVTRDRYRRRLQQAADAGVNLVRVWGGGIWESEDFYDAADELGLLVWQDFLLACAAYAEEEPLRSEILAESREAVARIGSHPALAVLNGNNENIWGHREWGWGPRLEGRTWGAGYYYDLFPALAAELAPHVVYTPGSPFSPDRAMEPNDESNGTMHLWEQWNRQDWTTYRDVRPRFVAEFGWQGPPAWSTLTESLDDDPLTPESPGMLVHQKAIDGNDKLTDGLVPHLPLPNTMPDWHWAMSLNQAVAVRTALQWFRSLQPHTSGAIVWQLNDCWPVVSWAAVDGAGRLKPLWYGMRQAFADRLITVQPDGDGLVAAVVNDTAEPWDDELILERRSYDGEVLARSTVPLRLAARAAVRPPVPTDVATPSDAADELLVARIGDQRGLWFFVEARDSVLMPAALDLEAVATAGGVEVRVTARNLVRELTLLVDVVDPSAEADDALVTLLPGESAVFRVTGTLDTAPERFLDPAVVRTANGLVALVPASAR